jgi:hypothetical protein
MTDYKATPEQWRQIENSQVFNGGFQACVLELRAKVEALEVNTKQWRIDHLRLANTCASMAPDRIRFFAQLMPDDMDSESESPSLKEQALVALHAIATGANNAREQHLDLDTIRRALEQLDD